jgi:H+/Cl- antiporter ClcA
MLTLQRRSGAGGGEVSEAIWLRDAHLPLASSLARGVISIVTVGMGASLGREGAPQLAGAAFASRASERIGLPAWQRRLLVACGAGAGMAAVYNVPLGGALFALEVLLGTITLPLVLPALATTLIATAVAWIAVPNRPTYHVPVYGLTAPIVVWALLVGPLAGLAAVVWVRAIGRLNALRPTSRAGRVAAPIVVFAALGAVSIPYPQLLGNGLDIVQSSLLGQLSFGLLAVLLVLKPLATVACLGSGSPGGLFTPTLAYGVLFGGTLGHVWTLVWPGAGSGSYALIGGAAVLAAAMQGPLAATALMVELTGHAEALIVPMLLAIVEATIVARLLRAQSIYSARLYVDVAAERDTAEVIGDASPVTFCRQPDT